MSPASPALAGEFFTTDPPGEPSETPTKTQMLPLITYPSESESEVAQLCPPLCDPMDCSLHQAPPSMGFSRQEYWSGLPFPSPGNLPDPGIKPTTPALASGFFTTEPHGELIDHI